MSADIDPASTMITGRHAEIPEPRRAEEPGTLTGPPGADERELFRTRAAVTGPVVVSGRLVVTDQRVLFVPREPEYAAILVPHGWPIVRMSGDATVSLVVGHPTAGEHPSAAGHIVEVGTIGDGSYRGAPRVTFTMRDGSSAEFSILGARRWPPSAAGRESARATLIEVVRGLCRTS